MGQTFFPIKSIFVDANHGPGTQYKVSVGHEMWEQGPRLVFKVQMVYNGKIAGRVCPSYPPEDI